MDRDLTDPVPRITDRKLNESVNLFGESGSGCLISLPSVTQLLKHLQLSPSPCGSHNISWTTVAAVLPLNGNTDQLLLEQIVV